MKKFLKEHREKINQIIYICNRYSLLLHLGLSFLICLFTESVSRHSLVEAVSFLWETPLTFLYNAMIIFVTFLLVYFFKRRTMVRVLISFIWCFLGVINGFVLAERVTPFGFTDFKLIKDLFSMDTTFSLPLLTAGVVGVLLLFLCFLIYLYQKGPIFQGKPHRILMLLVMASCLRWVPMITEAAVESQVVTDYFDNIALGYERYGFVYGFSTSVVDIGMEEPEGYSEEAVLELTREIGIADGESPNVSSQNINSSSKPNVVLVLLESFMDPREIRFLKMSADPIPNFRRLQEDYTSGYLSVPVVGAGTANTEFEVLTGMSIRFFGTGEYPYKTILRETNCESVAGVLSTQGYGTYVVHNNYANFYDRDNAFSMMGFDTFVSSEFMNIRQFTPLGNWPTDDILRQQVLACLDDTPGRSDFIYTITVQGHGGYPTEPILTHPEIEVLAEGLNEEENNAWEYYVNQIHEVDKFVGNLIADLSKRGEKTLVIFFGDHLPTMGLENINMVSGDIFKTCYATWNNFGLPKADADVTAYQLLSYMLKQIPLSGGTMIGFHQAFDARLSSEGDEAYINDMELLQYDVLYGERYAYGGRNVYPATKLELGLYDAVIKDVSLQGEELVITGEHFTPDSVVYINDEEVETISVSDTVLKVSLEGEKPPVSGDLIKVCQCSGDIILRSSQSVKYPFSAKK